MDEGGKHNPLNRYLGGLTNSKIIYDKNSQPTGSKRELP